MQLIINTNRKVKSLESTLTLHFTPPSSSLSVYMCSELKWRSFVEIHCNVIHIVLPKQGRASNYQLAAKTIDINNNDQTPRATVHTKNLPRFPWEVFYIYSIKQLILLTGYSTQEISESLSGLIIPSLPMLCWFLFPWETIHGLLTMDFHSWISVNLKLRNFLEYTYQGSISSKKVWFLFHYI